MFTLCAYALFKDYKRNALEAMAKVTHTDCQKLQYFFSDSQWDLQAIKQKRLEIIQNRKLNHSFNTWSHCSRTSFISIFAMHCLSSQPLR